MSREILCSLYVNICKYDSGKKFDRLYFVCFQKVKISLGVSTERAVFISQVRSSIRTNI
jgi:hypothetical protein